MHGRLDNFELAYRKKDGTHVHTLLSARPLTFEGEECLVAVARDISGHKETMEALRVSEEKYRVLVENAREGIIVSQKGRVVFANERAVTLSGFTLDELGDYSLDELIFPDDLEEALDRYRRVLKGENLEGDLEYRIVDRRGKIRRSVRISR